MNEGYWEEFYKTFKVTKPSQFARFVNNKLHKAKTIIDIGAGNNRDGNFFEKKGHRVIPIEKTYTASIEDLIEKSFDVEVAYCRWLFHAIDEDTEDYLLTWLSANLVGELYIEVRSDKDTNYKNDHLRRPANAEKFVKKLQDYGFEILYAEERRGFSKMGDDDPILIRIIAKVCE